MRQMRQMLRGEGMGMSSCVGGRWARPHLLHTFPLPRRSSRPLQASQNLRILTQEGFSPQPNINSESISCLGLSERSSISYCCQSAGPLPCQIIVSSLRSLSRLPHQAAIGAARADGVECDPTAGAAWVGLELGSVQ